MVKKVLKWLWVWTIGQITTPKVFSNTVGSSGIYTFEDGTISASAFGVLIKTPFGAFPLAKAPKRIILKIHNHKFKYV